MIFVIEFDFSKAALKVEGRLVRKGGATKQAQGEGKSFGASTVK